MMFEIILSSDNLFMNINQLTFPSAKAEITFPSADNDLLIFFASSRTIPSAPVLLTYKINLNNSNNVN